MLTNQYDAEFGRTAGAIVNAITKQGGNMIPRLAVRQLHERRVTAKDFFVEQTTSNKPETAQTDWGGTIGGPILKDKMHFFYSLDRIVYDEGRSNTFAVAARAELLEHADDEALEQHDSRRWPDQPEPHLERALPGSRSRRPTTSSSAA